MSIFKQNTTGFRQSIERMGIPSATVDAVWPEWWSAEAEGSKAAQTELRLTVARRLGLRPTTLFDDKAVEFVWQHEAKFKGLSTYSDREQSAITSFGQAFAQTILPAVEVSTQRQGLRDLDASVVRDALMGGNHPFPDIESLCLLCWSLGIPIVHLRVFPLPAKRMAAMAVRVGKRHAILIARDASYPAPTAFHIAHEMAHIALGHLDNTAAVVDIEILGTRGDDAEELEADRYALQILTGSPEPIIEMNEAASSGKQLSRAVDEAIRRGIKVEPGTLCLCYGYQTGDWKVAHAALQHIYSQRYEVWKFLNTFATREIVWDALAHDSRAYVRAVLGAVELA